MFKASLKLFLICVSSLIFFNAYGAQDSDDETANIDTQSDIGYYNLEPAFTTNVATLNPQDKMHYVRVKISLMLNSNSDTKLVSELDPIIRDAVIAILGSEEFSAVSSMEGRENIRIKCRDRLASLLEDKIGRPVINDVLFLNYIYQ